ncbi:hypothetical protein C2S51_014169 [Perilla frutescens var. frutescens]|nr:hypothetical protein C2S51_014169 [Perilla frutescens var. frutescens]
MAAAVLKVLAVAFAVAVSLAGAGVSAQTHHVVGGGPDFNVTAWLLGRRFTVGDKIRLEYSGGDESMVEVRGAEELESCNVKNPINMYTEAVALDEEGIRYLTSSNPDKCREGLKLAVPVERSHEYDPSPPYDPYKPDVPYPPHPSAATLTRLNGLWFLFSAAVLSIYYYIRI